MTEHDVATTSVAPASSVTPASPVTPVPVLDDHHEEGPRPIGTLMVVAILVLVTIAFWMLVLGIQQARA